jgi:predicted nucleic acid-binding protein
MLCSDRFRFEPVTEADLARIVELTETYADLPLGRTDASVIGVAERLGFETVATLDRRPHSSPA